MLWFSFSAEQVFRPRPLTINFGTIPADGQYHSKTFVFTIPNPDLSAGAYICAGDGDGNGNSIGDGFDGCDVVETLPQCSAGSSGYAAAPIPEGYQLHVITCDTPVYTAAGDAVPDTLVTAGQTWYIDPAATGEWTGIFVAGTDQVYIPSSCIGTAQ